MTNNLFVMTCTVTHIVKHHFIDFKRAKTSAKRKNVGFITKRSRGEAECMIEDFMLTANETVARLGREKGMPLLYRVHEKPDPDKLQVFSDFIAPLGVNTRPLAHHAKPGDIRAILEKTRAWPEFRVVLQKP